jgi:hypothetical protein
MDYPSHPSRTLPLRNPLRAGVEPPLHLLGAPDRPDRAARFLGDGFRLRGRDAQEGGDLSREIGLGLGVEWGGREGAGEGEEGEREGGKTGEGVDGGFPAEGGVSGVTSGFPVRFPVRRRMWSRMPTST